MDKVKVLRGAESAKMACWQDSKELSRIHGLHVSELGEAITAKLIRVEEGGEAAIHVESLVVEPLEDFLGDVGFNGIFGMVRGHHGIGG